MILTREIYLLWFMDMVVLTCICAELKEAHPYWWMSCETASSFQANKLGNVLPSRLTNEKMVLPPQGLSIIFLKPHLRAHSLWSQVHPYARHNLHNCAWAALILKNTTFLIL